MQVDKPGRDDAPRPVLDRTIRVLASQRSIGSNGKHHVHAGRATINHQQTVRLKDGLLGRVETQKGCPVAVHDLQAYARTTSFATPTAQGQLLKSIVMNLTGGARPIFYEGFANEGLQGVVWGTFGDDGSLGVILTA